jgi:hypothetical protein
MRVSSLATFTWNARLAPRRGLLSVNPLVILLYESFDQKDVLAFATCSLDPGEGRGLVLPGAIGPGALREVDRYRRRYQSASARSSLLRGSFAMSLPAEMLHSSGQIDLYESDRRIPRVRLRSQLLG